MTMELTVACPCCGAKLTVDPELKAVIAHEPPPKSGPASSLDAALKGLSSKAAEREAAFKAAQEAERTKSQLLDRKLGEAMKKASKEPPSKPKGPFDLD